MTQLTEHGHWSTHSALRLQLETRRLELLRRVSRITGDLRAPRSPDWEEQASEVENDEVLEGLDAMSRAEVLAINATLRRMTDGRFGFCVRCGEAIDEPRLAAVPTAATCINCAA